MAVSTKKSAADSKVAREILEKFSQWVRDSVITYREIPPANPLCKAVLEAKIDTLEFAEKKLQRIVGELSE